MELQRFHASIIATVLTTRSFVLKRFTTDVFPALADSVNKILAAIAIGTSLCQVPPYFYSRLLYQLSYRGTTLV
jgi:hypothetical protein